MTNTWTAADVARLWMNHHPRQHWKTLLAQYAETPVLPTEVMKWLARKTADIGNPLMIQLNEGQGLEAAKTLARFEEAFIANIDQCLGQLS